MSNATFQYSFDLLVKIAIYTVTSVIGFYHHDGILFYFFVRLFFVMLILMLLFSFCWPNVRTRCWDIDQVLFLVVYRLS